MWGMDQLYRCPRCLEEKPLSGFYVPKGRRSPYCRPCTTQANRDYRNGIKGRKRETPIEKTCIRCHQTKPAADFCKKSNHKDGLHNTCRKCMSAKKRFARYGVTMKWFDECFAAQDGRCAICPELITEATCHVDHDHETGAPRDLLCVNCNWGLGSFKDSPELLELAAEYLRRHARR